MSIEITIKKSNSFYIMRKHLVNMVKYVNPDVWHCIDQTSRSLVELRNKLLRWTRCSGFLRLWSLWSPWGHRRMPLSPPGFCHLLAYFPKYCRDYVAMGYKLKVPTVAFEQSNEKYKENIMWYFSESHILGNHWVTSILRHSLRHCG